ncbi:hypothetical protein Cst_c07890 [Thermoclostridium stercorarium subsp. stercorarium DSM 8532]|uniref:Uncharacterized protein n=3 Tax=Thermoclostridium stercorarium TaxID=1510 RepID=L7VQF3_THES1|nr:hypothetical protein Cst_c07890 [Thermoclostridium stercorarium subsp. stercorarium DSM 8532]
MAKKAGHRGRFVLTYDCAFLALLMDSLEDGPVSGKQRRCLFHPLKKRYIVDSNSAVEYASDINILLSYYNLKDKWQDERNLLGPAGMAVLKKGYGKVKKKYPELAAEIERELSRLHELERRKCDSIDEASEPFARMMQTVFQQARASERIGKVLGWIGYNLGKWIYILDAYDDIEDNIKNGSYNPLVVQYRYESSEGVNSFRERIKEKAEFILIYSLSELEKAFSLLDIRKNKSILDNIIYRGLLVRTRNVLQMGADCHEKSV